MVMWACKATCMWGLQACACCICCMHASREHASCKHECCMHMLCMHAKGQGPSDCI